MKRSYLCAAAAITLSAASFPAAALIFGAGPKPDIRAASATDSLTAAPRALSPEGRPVRVISLSDGNKSEAVAVAAAQPDASGPNLSGLVSRPDTKLVADPQGQISAVVIRRSEHAASTPKPAPPARRNAQSASKPLKTASAVATLF
ncbi:hypothetical protein SAMN05519103_00281 [Rhizobiales bacterium GAS113]|nr:hypothetical protein SAMN05519103_00281 [Rhizobiales bacterium GAS113]